MENDVLWKNVLSVIEVKLDSPPDFRTWFVHTHLVKYQNGEAVVGCKNQFVIDWLERNYTDLIKSSIEKYTGNQARVSFQLSSGERNVDSRSISAPIFNIESDLNELAKKRDEKALRSGLNPKYRFDNYIVGTSNRLAHAAALAIVDNPGITYNPFYVYGGVGLGKTHILQSIGNELLYRNPKAKLLYCSCEAFLNELVNAIRTNKTAEFRAKYRELDLLMLDDIQFISNKTETQNELFHTFNVLHQANKQIILASDRPPTEIQNLEDRLKSRFQGGMVADISEPDYEMRVAILMKKRDERKLNVDNSSIQVIARIVERNIRELEGALIKVAAVAGINNGIISESEIEKILGRDAKTLSKKVKPRAVIDMVCDKFAVNIREIRGKSRKADIAFARQIAMYILRKDLNLPLVKVAEDLNRTDHTTVLHAVQRVEEELEANKQLQESISAIRRELFM